MNKLFAVAVATLFAATAFAQAPAPVAVPSHSVHPVRHEMKHVVKHHPKHMKRVVHHRHHRAPMRHKM